MTPVRYPARMVGLMGATAEGREWLAGLPALVAAASERWELTLGEPEPESFVSVVFPAERPDGERIVLKLSFPDRETRHEAAALAAYDGEGAVRLLAADANLGALLLERAEPGTPLALLPDVEEADAIAATVLARLWRKPPDAHPFEAAADRAAEWAREQSTSWERAGRPFERSLAEEAAALFAELAEPAERPVLLHQDFHHGNVLAARREPWLAIDPKPLVGERAFDVPCLLRNRTEAVFGAAHPAAALERRLARIAEALVVDRERIRAWSLAQAVELGLWCYEVGDRAGGEHLVSCARLFRELG